MPEFWMPDIKRYYRTLEIGFIVALTTMMILFGLIFAGNANQSVFVTLRLSQIHITPVGFALGCIAFGAACPFVLASPWIKRKSVTWRQSAAVIISAPILLYLLTVFAASFPRSLNLTLIYYLSNWILIMLAPLALYQGYQVWIEWVSTAALIIIHVLSAIFVLINPTILVFERFNADLGTAVSPVHHAALSLLCALGYALLLAPLPKFSCSRRRVLWIIFEMPIAAASMLWIYNAWRETGAPGIPPAAFLNLAAMIGVLGFALCPTGRRRMVGITESIC